MDKGMKMSSGERQLANYLFVMNANNIEWLYLDEAFGAVPIEKRKELYSEILKKFKNVHIIDHDINLDIKHILL
jgi:ABC-type Mn2+/Zn2+ transport system ATPase subunit